MLRDLLWDHFSALVRAGALRDASPERRHAVFAQLRIPFPIILSPAHAQDAFAQDAFAQDAFAQDAFAQDAFAQDAPHAVLPVEDARHRPLWSGDPCPCGSALAYDACCGRIPGPPGPLTGP